MNTQKNRRLNPQAGITLYILAGAMAALLSISALSIDLVSFYVARNEAQRTANAAALAGATVFVTQGCTNLSGGCVPGGPQEAPATQRALDVAAQNTVVGQVPSSSSVSVSFSYVSPQEPQINVTVYRDSGHSNAMPTVFGKVLGITDVDVSASATAEAFNPTGSNTAIGDSCIRPFLVPNCDPDHLVAAGNAEANTNCPTIGGLYQSYFYDPNNNNVVVNPGLYRPGPPASGGIIGESWTLHSDAGPSQWYTIAFAGQSGSAYEQNIYTCVPLVISCDSPLNSLNGKKVGPTDAGIQTLIHASGDGLGQGQDILCSPTSTPACPNPPFTVTGGYNNPNPNLQGKTFDGSGSSSVVSVVVYDGQALPPSGTTVHVIGFMQMFISDVVHSGTDDAIDAVILSVGSCGTSIGSGPPVQSSGGSPIPIRLIHK